MKKFPILLSLLIISAMVLAACGSSGDENREGNENGAGTPAGQVTGTMPVSGTAGAVTGTPASGAAAGSVTATAVVNNEVTATVNPNTATTPQGNASGQSGATGTPNVPVTGSQQQCRVDNLSQLLGYTVRDSSGVEVGKIGGAVLLRDTSVMPVNTATPGTNVTPAANNSDNGATNSGAAQMVKSVEPVIDYLILDLSANNSASGKQVLVPYKAFKLDAYKNDAAGSATAVANTPAANVTGTPNAAGTPAPDASNQTGANANGSANNTGQGLSSVCAVGLTLKGADLANAPVYDKNAAPDFTAKNWDEAFRAYWNGKVQVVPVTGGDKMGAPVVMSDGWHEINAVNANGDDLGEVVNFITNPKTGALTYAVLKAGGFLGIGAKYVPVPMSVVTWQIDDKDIAGLGRIVINTAKDQWQNAPS